MHQQTHTDGVTHTAMSIEMTTAKRYCELHNNRPQNG
jgi:hypothetical protein